MTEFDEIDIFICNQLADEEWKQKADEGYQKALQEDWNQYQHKREDSHNFLLNVAIKYIECYGKEVISAEELIEF